jgi:Rrf2 family cysteine metabolism transcriptional repressor
LIKISGEAMKISTKGRYALKLLIYLANNFGKGPVLLKDISKATGIPLKYLEQLVIPLKNAGFVISKRGKSGGYLLICDPKKITLKDIVETMEGKINIVDCVKHPEVCTKSDKCYSHVLWSDINGKIENIFSNYTLYQICKWDLQNDF